MNNDPTLYGEIIESTNITEDGDSVSVIIFPDDQPLKLYDHVSDQLQVTDHLAEHVTVLAEGLTELNAERYKEATNAVKVWIAKTQTNIANMSAANNRIRKVLFALKSAK